MEQQPPETLQVLFQELWNKYITEPTSKNMRNSPNGAFWCLISEGGLFQQTEQCDNLLYKRFIAKSFQCMELKLANSNESVDENLRVMFKNGYRQKCKLCHQGTLFLSHFCPYPDSWFLNIDFELESQTLSDILSGAKTIQFEECSFTLAGLIIYDVKRGEDLYKIDIF
jgi:hypothetical protein